MNPDLAKITKKMRRGWGSAQAGGVTAETFRALLENSLDAFVLFDSGWKITYASASTQRVLGYAPADIHAADAFSFIHPDDVVKVKDAFSECLANPGKPVRSIARIRHKDGSWRVLEGLITNFLSVADLR